MKTFLKTAGYIGAVGAGLAGGFVMLCGLAFIGLLFLLDPGTTAAELEEAKGRCEMFLRDMQENNMRDVQEPRK